MTTGQLKDARPICFVVMGFGKKTDYELGMTFDLDATYHAIIAPAAQSAGLRPIRADELLHAGVIDVKMYEMLLRADVVVADISTGNVNAMYELGIRHALRPNTTIIMKEDRGRLYFDLNHVNTLQYRHMGEDIGFSEACRMQPLLAELIQTALSSGAPDSPVYTFLPGLKQPIMSDVEFAILLNEAEESQERMSDFLRAGEKALEESDMPAAVRAYTAARELKPDEPFILQSLVLATYKAKLPSEAEALINAQQLLAELQPENSNDPETLGLAGAIRKRLWPITHDPYQLDMAIRHYGRGFEVRRDYYNGENLALCLEMRAEIQSDLAERQFDRMRAQKTRVILVELIQALMAQEDFEDRSDKKWVFATMAHCLFALGKHEEAYAFENRFKALSPPKWEIDTFLEGKAAAIARSAEN